MDITTTSRTFNEHTAPADETEVMAPILVAQEDEDSVTFRLRSGADDTSAGRLVVPRAYLSAFALFTHAIDEDLSEPEPPAE